MRAIERADAFVADLERQGVRFSIEAGRLVARPARLLTPELRSTLVANAAAVAATVREGVDGRAPISEPRGPFHVVVDPGRSIHADLRTLERLVALLNETWWSTRAAPWPLRETAIRERCEDIPSRF